MQRLDFITNLEIIASKLRSKDVMNYFKRKSTRQDKSTLGSFSEAKMKDILEDIKYEFIEMVDQTFVTYEELHKEHRYSNILDNLPNYPWIESKYLYNQNNRNKHSIAFSEYERSIFQFHDNLLTTLKITKTTLINSTVDADFETLLNDGVIILQVLTEDEYLNIENYIKIFNALQRCIETLSHLWGETVKTDIVLLDSGSDTNIGIKTGVDTAKSLFLIFKEIWEWLIDHKYYKFNKKNEALLKSLSIRAELKKLCDTEVITEEEMLEYVEIIKKSTDSLLGLNVVPKQLISNVENIKRKELLTQIKKHTSLKN